ncbi:CHAD domain-containing protein [Planctomyces sp. SH-PL62]|uniref:CHAD domain-containing protein n=1 Tax=Planctomyces sp. SH-PL62 TaxID=1636152 RepID=UPI00078C9824|nr:CHAD domain-containing protein [Planctomyces sp. SH-PL62]AMV38661.1 CHAD domain protein [Planctomyces sp. SH-PL62]
MTSPVVPKPDSLRDAIPRTKPSDPAAKAVTSSLRSAVERLQAAEALAREGDVEGPHRLRTSARRLRSELRAFSDLVEPEWRTRLEGELKWLGNAIGEVRDLDVLRERFEKGESDEHRLALAPLFEWLAERHATATRTMHETLDGERFRAVLAELRTGLANPPLVARARKPCHRVLPPLVAKAWERLRKDARGLDADTPDPIFHDLRKRAKRARYTTELIAPALGSRVEKPAEGLIRLARKIQDLLGEHQDTIVAGTEVETFVAQGSHDESFRQAAQALLQRLRAAADASRDAFLKLRPKLAKPKYAGRLKPKR